MQTLRIVTRKSKLALWQAEFIKCQLATLYPALSIDIVGITTKGDQILDRSLNEVGGKGLFVKELELALQNGMADIAIHCLKDMPSYLSAEFEFAAILKRDDAADAFLSNKYTDLSSMPPGSVIGTSSPRRIAMLKHYYPKFTTKLIRGNIDSRINKLDMGEYDGIILAVSGLQRLNLAYRIKQRLNVDKFIPAIGQGALAVQILANMPKLKQLLMPLMHQESFITTAAEREVGHFLKAGCNVPIAVYATISSGLISLDAVVADLEEDCYYSSKSSALVHDYILAAHECAHSLIKQGALRIIKKYTHCL